MLASDLLLIGKAGGEHLCLQLEKRRRRRRASELDSTLFLYLLSACIPFWNITLSLWLPSLCLIFVFNVFLIFNRLQFTTSNVSWHPACCVIKRVRERKTFVHSKWAKSQDLRSQVLVNSECEVAFLFLSFHFPSPSSFYGRKRELKRRRWLQGMAVIFD